jgi:HlyD family secretion protein
MKKSTKLGIAGTLVLAAALLAWAFAPRPADVEVAEVRQGLFETTIDEDARTRLVDRYTVSAPLAGRLDRIALREGDAVQAGQVVATLAPVLAPMLDARSRAEQRARADGAEAGVKRAATRTAAARVALELARTELRRIEQLAAQGFVSPLKLETDRLGLQAAQRELDTAVEGEHIAGHELQLARAALATTGSGAPPAAAFAVRSPVAGHVLKVVQPSEAAVGVGAPLLEIGDLARLEVVAELLTADALAAAPGRPVRIERWGGPGDLDGRVRRIEPAAFTKVSALGVEEQRVNALIEITSPRERWAALGDGFRVGVRIVTRSEPQAVLVPVSAVFPDGAAQAVFVVEGRRARLREVKLGGRNASAGWVTEGLKPGERVIVYPPAAVADGSRIRERSV